MKNRVIVIAALIFAAIITPAFGDIKADVNGGYDRITGVGTTMNIFNKTLPTQEQKDELVAEAQDIVNLFERLDGTGTDDQNPTISADLALAREKLAQAKELAVATESPAIESVAVTETPAGCPECPACPTTEVAATAENSANPENWVTPEQAREIAQTAIKESGFGEKLDDQEGRIYALENPAPGQTATGEELETVLENQHGSASTVTAN
ncbi:MAG: hypothetical protein WC450_10825, partial [Candidatus Omnitrophota bacterium]